MADKPGDIFTDKQGIRYELRPDPKDGHLRPVTLGKGDGSYLTGILTAVVVGVVWGAVTEVTRYAWQKMRAMRKDNKV
jgi:hypothetical protein